LIPPTGRRVNASRRVNVSMLVSEAMKVRFYSPWREIAAHGEAQGIEAEIPQAPAGGRGIGADSPVRRAAPDAPKSARIIVSEY
jgi:hypothetical protein